MSTLHRTQNGFIWLEPKRTWNCQRGMLLKHRPHPVVFFFFQVFHGPLFKFSWQAHVHVETMHVWSVFCFVLCVTARQRHPGPYVLRWFPHTCSNNVTSEERTTSVQVKMRSLQVSPSYTAKNMQNASELPWKICNLKVKLLVLFSLDQIYSTLVIINEFSFVWSFIHMNTHLFCSNVDWGRT